MTSNEGVHRPHFSVVQSSKVLHDNLGLWYICWHSAQNVWQIPMKYTISLQFRVKDESTIFEPFGVRKNVNNNTRSEEIALKLSVVEKIIGWAA